MENVSLSTTMDIGDVTTSTVNAVAETSGYRLVHGYVSGTICFIGIILNIFNAIIWSRKSMRTSTNYILTALAIADMLSLSCYFLYATYFFTATGPSEMEQHSKAGMYLVVICFHEFISFHTFSNWLTISLAIFRYVKVCKPFIAKTYCNIRRANLTIFIVFGVTTLAAIPFYIFYEIYDLSTENKNLSGYWIRKTHFTNNHIDYQMALLWLYGVIFKVVPSIAMIVLSGLMIRALKQAKKRKDDLRSSSKPISTGYSRTTVMLIIIVMIYVITELPIGISAFLAGIEGGESHFFYFLLYSHVGDLLDLTTLFNGAVNFVVYYVLSKQFRRTFKYIILGKVFTKYSTSQSEQTAPSSDNVEMSTVNSKSVGLFSIIRKSFKK